MTFTYALICRRRTQSIIKENFKDFLLADFLCPTDTYSCVACKINNLHAVRLIIFTLQD